MSVVVSFAAHFSCKMKLGVSFDTR